MNFPSYKVIVVFVIAVIGISGIFYLQDNSEFFSPQPEIYVDEISISYHQLGCYVGFNLVNSEDVTAFVNVDISSEYLIKQYQYLVYSGSVYEKYLWAEQISIDNCDEQNITVKVANVIEWYVNDEDVFLDDYEGRRPV